MPATANEKISFYPKNEKTKKLLETALTISKFKTKSLLLEHSLQVGLSIVIGDELNQYNIHVTNLIDNLIVKNNKQLFNVMNDQLITYFETNKVVKYILKFLEIINLEIIDSQTKRILGQQYNQCPDEIKNEVDNLKRQLLSANWLFSKKNQNKIQNSIYKNEGDIENEKSDDFGESSTS